ncbi:MAG: hypothetical protein R2688_10715 [Fimbriimonadaceae bacterium]
MLIPLALLMSPMQQQPTNQPTEIYAAMPAIGGLTGLSAERQLHSVTVTIGKETATFETLTTFRSEAGGEGNVGLTFLSRGRTHYDIKDMWASWNKVDMEIPDAMSTKSMGGPDRPGMISTQMHVYNFPVSMPPKGTGALRMKFTLPLAKVGYGLAQREIKYRFGAMMHGMDQLRMIIKYDPNTVFNVEHTDVPAGKMEVGPNGAYWKADGLTFEGKGEVTFRFFPKQLQD